jgi:endonuclease/exonuclease/phosphatase family metal-dependent hydrolase
MKSHQNRRRAALCPALASFHPTGERLEDRAMLSGFEGGDDREITVLTRNLYVGFHTEDVVAALGTGNPGLFIPAIRAGWDMLESNNFPERAAALAEEIDQTDPLLVGLQEVSKLMTGEFLSNDAATDDDPRFAGEGYDYLQLLLDALAARGLHYAPIAVLDNLDVEFPGQTDDGLRDVRLIDRDVILARTDLPASQFKISNVQTEHFENLRTLLPGVEQPRGWLSVDAKVRGKSFRFVNTHLEPGYDGTGRAIQEAQSLELLAGATNTNLPVIMAGDFNSESDPNGTFQQSDSYDNIIAAGFQDLWAVEYPGIAGNTHGFGDEDGPFAGDLHDPDPTREQRIDFIFYRGDWQPEDAELLGEQLGDKTPSGLWPSDHVGVAGTLNLHDRPSDGNGVALFVDLFSHSTSTAGRSTGPSVAIAAGNANEFAPGPEIVLPVTPSAAFTSAGDPGDGDNRQREEGDTSELVNNLVDPFALQSCGLLPESIRF